MAIPNMTSDGMEYTTDNESQMGLKVSMYCLGVNLGFTLFLGDEKAG
jgi:hypothetical protein